MLSAARHAAAADWPASASAARSERSPPMGRLINGPGAAEAGKASSGCWPAPPRWMNSITDVEDIKRAVKRNGSERQGTRRGKRRLRGGKEPAMDPKGRSITGPLKTAVWGSAQMIGPDAVWEINRNGTMPWASLRIDMSLQKDSMEVYLWPCCLCNGHGT